MKECLITNKVCSESNRKCKICAFSDCKEVLNMLDVQEKYINKERLQKLKRNLPEQCKNCSFLEVINLEKQKIRCFYRAKDRCILK